jgi:hypothetical protein
MRRRRYSTPESCHVINPTVLVGRSKNNRKGQYRRQPIHSTSELSAVQPSCSKFPLHNRTAGAVSRGVAFLLLCGPIHSASVFCMTSSTPPPVILPSKLFPYVQTTSRVSDAIICGSGPNGSEAVAKRSSHLSPRRVSST